MQMKYFLSLCLALSGIMTCHAQSDDAVADTVKLGEIIVKGTKVVRKTDRVTVYPSAMQKQNSPSAYSLLKKLPLSDLHVDDVNNTISINSLIGTVEMRINDTKATPADLLSLDMKAIQTVEYITSPGVKYGKGVGRVVNIVTRNATSGYNIGAEAFLPFTTLAEIWNAHGKVNGKWGELSADYHGSYRDEKRTFTNEHGTYLMADGTTTRFSRTQRERRTKVWNHGIQMRHSLVKPQRFILQTTLGMDMARTPNYKSLTDVTKNGQTYIQLDENTKKSLSPTRTTTRSVTSAAMSTCTLARCHSHCLPTTASAI